MRKKCLLIFMIVLMVSFTGCSKYSTDIQKYLNSGTNIDTDAKNFMPKLEELPKYQDISYKYNHSSIILFESDAITLVVEYDEETYEKEKEKLTEKYKFLDQKVVSDFDKDKYYIPEYEFQINNYDFKVVEESDNYKAKYPKSFGIIGTSDEEKSIAYLYFYDSDLDYIEEDNESPMVDFVKEYFKYDF